MQTDWLHDYLEHRLTHPIQLDIFQPGKLGLPEDDRFESLHYPLYRMLQLSGLVYGLPVQYPFQPQPERKLSKREIIQLTLLDVLTTSVLLEFPDAALSYEAQLQRAVDWIRLYYEQIGPFIGQKGPSDLDRILRDRTSFRRYLLDFGRSGVNPHLFWDWYYFLEYCRKRYAGQSMNEEAFSRLMHAKKNSKILTNQLMIAAAHSDREIQRAERLMKYLYRRSARLFTEADKERLRKALQEGIELEEIRLPDLNWTARRYLLDISLLAVHADREIKPEEEAFLEKLMVRLNLHDDSLLDSKTDLGFFLIKHGKKLHFFDARRSGLALVTQAMGENMRKIVGAGKMEYQETVDMAETLARLLQHQLGLSKDPERLPTEAEIAQAFDQMKDLPRFLPFFTVWFVPVPGITEAYILFAYTIERLLKDKVRLLPSQFSRMVRKK